MFGNREHIALLVANITDPFSNSVAKGAMSEAKRLGADLTIFPGKYIGLQDKYDEHDTTYEYQHNLLFKHASNGGFDCIIAAVGTIAYALDHEGQKRFLESLGNVPVICVAADIEGYDCLEFDNRTVMYEIVGELASQGRKHIGIMAGDFHSGECRERYEAFLCALDKYGVDFDERYVMPSDMSEYCQREACELIERAPELDAIVCVNDKVAAVICDQLKKHGKAVGKDVAVVGFDDLPVSAELFPPLATVRADAVGLGARSVEKAVNKLRGIEDNDKYYPTEFIKRASCTMENYAEKLYDKISENELEIIRQKELRREHIENIFARDSLMYGNNIKSSYADILKRMSMIGADLAFLYTFPEPVKHRQNDILGDDISWCFRSYSYGEKTYTVAEEEQYISYTEVFKNKYLCADRQHCFIAADLFITDTQYGMMLFEPNSTDFFHELELVTYIISSAVRTIDILDKQERLLQKLKMANLALEKESHIDELTGLYNRRGFYMAAEKLIDRCGVGTQYFICYADLDNLKLINDNYGHIEGDHSLKMTAECLRSVFGEAAVIGRMGGDEFAAMLCEDAALTAEGFIESKDIFVEEYNLSGDKPYKFGVSMGILNTRCENGYDLKAALDNADDLLYLQKKKRKKEISKKRG